MQFFLKKKKKLCFSISILGFRLLAIVINLGFIDLKYVLD